MVYQEFQPDSRLAGFVSNYWWFENTTPQPLDFTILPDGCFDLIFHLKAGKIIEASLTGLWTRPVDVTIEPGSQSFAIRFRLLAVDYLFRQSIAAICDGERSVATDYWEAHQVDMTNQPAAVAHFDQVMVAILAGGKPVDAKKQQLFDLLHQTGGEQTIDWYACQVFWSARQINRYCNERFGISLKQYCTILKLFASFRQIRKGQLYPAGNFFDQSHFIKYVRKLTGCSPLELYQNKNDRFLQLKILPAE
ncbi:helix-turn-helix domain-containing protein [Paraflavitalea pollutisoli]|uniref:helix-turn-helix domain-containing protein n=1 Tax=Paraflavitalea pollutisoli TaxID=3034143 RepID=UPI0023ED4CDF|nr:helix-turn-helix domain-containing protein [Paraflavitalea sp. H1-2-19X]